MKAFKLSRRIIHKTTIGLTNFILVVSFLFVLLPMGHALSFDPGGGGTNSSPTYTPLNSWSFRDNTNWTSDKGYAPISFTNLAYSYLGNGSSLVVNSNVPALVQFKVIEDDGNTNLTVDSGTVTFWYAPANWSSTNAGGNGPGEFGRLLEVGGYTPDSSYGQNASSGAIANGLKAPASAFERLEARSLQDPAKISDLTASMKANGWQGKPISVFEHNGAKYILDGHHRVAAARAAGIDVPYVSVPESQISNFGYKSVNEVINASVEAGGR